MKNARKSLDEICSTPEPTFTILDDYYDCMYFRVVFSKETGELIGTCRFGKYYDATTNDVWDFGFNVLLSHWYKGYGGEIVAKIIELAKTQGVKKIRGGADIENYGSYKTMIKNGFDFVDYDKDGDYEYMLDLSKPAKTQTQIDSVWETHLAMTKKDLGEEKFRRLESINAKNFEMVQKIKSGESEDELVEEYFKKLNAIEEFKFC